ncbi:MAG: iron complex outermembrane recepter protein [Candidatus Nitrotoga sp. SPKER]|nr:MAG: iron complex outermembrane recepter protein [Candidatus Nitrotoga sp. SPKER]
MPNKPFSFRRIIFLAVLSTNMGLPVTVLADEDSATLGEIKVSGKKMDSDYRTDKVKIGPLSEKLLLDTPYAIDVVPAELMRNQQFKSVREAFRYLPSVQGENIRPQTRGLQAGVVQNTRIDGMNIAATTDYPIEQFERIEVLNGLAGAIYGPSNPAGTFNYVIKRPTDEPLRRIGVGYGTQSAALGSLDLGGYVDKGKVFGYRLNLLNDTGEGYVDRSRLERKLVSLAADINFTNATKLELNASRYHYLSMGFPGTFSLQNDNVRFPSAPDPKRVGYGQPFGGDNNITKTFSGKLKHSFNADWQISAGLLQQDSDRASTVPTNTLTNNAGNYTTTAATTTFSLDRILSNTVALNGHAKTGDWTHDLVFSSTGFTWDRYTPNKIGAITLGSASLDNPIIFNAPVFPDFSDRYKSQTTRQQSLNIGDTISFNKQWSATLIASQSWITARSNNKAGVETSRYDKEGISTNAILSYKPQSNMMVYGSYADSLQQADPVPNNPQVILAPYRSKQWELGYKVRIAKMNLTAALFRVERPYPYIGADGVFRVQGNQVNNGLELTVNGTLTRDLTIYSGVTILDPRLENTLTAATEGKQILGLSKVVSSVLLDYRIAPLPGLSVNLHIANAISRPGNHINTYSVAGFTTVDVGTRYYSQIMGKAASWNLTLYNLANERYWANITPNGQNGFSATGNGTGTLGAPRTLRASLQIDF